jgi:restriction endonuclease Mrr
MTFTEAAAHVLRISGKPLHYKEITEMAIEKNLLSHVGKSPEVTMGARLAALLKKEDKTNPIVRVKPGIFALREWKGGKGTPMPDMEVPEDGEGDVNALEVEAAQATMHDDDEDGPKTTPLSGDDVFRAELAAEGAELFGDEDDDDQPIMGGTSEPPPGSDDPNAAAGDSDPNRRRRRRRRRGRGGREGEAGVEGGAPGAPRLDGSSNGDSPGFTEAPERVEGFNRPVVRERTQFTAPNASDIPVADGDELAGRELADAAIIVLSSFDRGQGAAPIRSVAEILARKGRLPNDPTTASGALSASLRADNLRRQAQGQRQRFRFAAQGRVALTDWSMNPDLVRLEQDALLAIERYREAARKTMLRKLQELPGHGFVELCLLTLERLGMTSLRPVRRSGSPGGELHFAGIHRTGADEIRTAVVIRKDGREIGRERVTDLRGAMHHYGPATAGWLITTGQVLSGAREEASTPGTSPIALYDGLSFCRLLDEQGVAVTRATLTIGIPDMELLETLRGS